MKAALSSTKDERKVGFLNARGCTYSLLRVENLESRKPCLLSARTTVAIKKRAGNLKSVKKRIFNSVAPDYKSL
jgi:hypothetical protein